MAAQCVLEYLFNIEVLLQVLVGAPQPVIEVPGDDNWIIIRDMRTDSPYQCHQLALPLLIEESQVYTDDVYTLVTTGHHQCAVKQASARRSHIGYIDIFPADERVFAKDCIAMMACSIDRIFTIGVMLPDLVGKKLELPVVRPVIETVFRDRLLAMDLLQEHHVRIDMA